MEQFTEEEFNATKGCDHLQLGCDTCGDIFERPKRGIVKSRRTKGSHSCSRKCVTEAMIRSKGFKHKVETSCALCDANILKYPRELIEFNFCNNSCSATFRNLRKVDNQCLTCDKNLSSSKRKYCSHTCQQQYQNKIILEDWKSGETCGHRTDFSIREPIRNYIVNKYNNKCAECGWDTPHPNTGKIPLQIHHIDGKASNCSEDNLILLCPNCHSLTPNYGGRNKSSDRVMRYNKTGATCGN
jgi:hypothetical protein